jgi:hypothetical protein
LDNKKGGNAECDAKYGNESKDWKFSRRETLFSREEERPHDAKENAGTQTYSTVNGMMEKIK